MDENLTIEDFGTDELIEELGQRSVGSEKQMLNTIRAILDLKSWHDKARIIQEINNLS